MDKDEVVQRVQEAFADVEYPGDWCLTNSNEGSEPLAVAEEFKGKDDWRTIDVKFLDTAPRGLSSALNFFSDEARRFYLPAYMIADLDGKLEQTDLTFHLCQNVRDSSRNTLINPRRYGERTWFDHAQFTFSVFRSREVAAIVTFLEFKNRLEGTLDMDKTAITEALRNYWSPRVQALREIPVPG